MNIGIVGAGTASAIAVMSMLNAARQRNVDNLAFTCINDPSKPTAQVGESTSGLVHDIMRDVLGVKFLEDIDVYNGTLRYYTRYHWEKANGKNFNVFYDKPGLHLNSEKWSTYIFNKLSAKYDNFVEIHDSVTTIEQTDNFAIVKGGQTNYSFDFVIDCRGMPSNEELNSDKYETDVFESVNSVILFPDFKNYEESNTSAYIHDNGWMFGVPLQHRKAFGYLYNNNITSYNEAVSDFSKIKGIDASTLRNFSWRQYYKKHALDGRILAMGNRLYFFEPQQAIPLHYYALLASCFIDGIMHGVSIDKLQHGVNSFAHTAMENIQNLIAFNYCGPNNIDSKFWNVLIEKARSHLINSKNWQDWLDNVESQGQVLGYAPVDSSMMNSYIKGLDIDLKTLKGNYEKN